MAQDPTRISPTDYSASAYDILSKYDPAFSENVSVEGFFENLQNPEYAAKAYAILADADPELVNNLSLDEFFSNVKKKEEPAVTESVSDVGSSEQRLASRDLEAERVRRTPVIRDIGFQGAAYNYVPPTTSEYYTPAEQAKRDSIRTERDIREADIQAQRKATAQEMAELVTADLAPVTIPEGNVPGVVSQLSETYGPYGIEFSEEKVPMATTRQGARIVKAIAKGPGGKPVEMRLALDEGGNIAQSEADKLDDFVRTNARVVGETDESFVEKSLRLQELRPVARLDSSGVSTVKMAWGEMDGKYIAYPTLFPKDPDITPSTNPNDWMELGLGAQAMNEAEKRGELFFFDTAVEAAAFADGKWKNIVPEDVEFQRRAQELGRDYDADMAFLDEVDARRAEYRFLEELIPGTRYEKEIPADYDKYFIDGNLVRDDIEAMRAEKEAELSTLEGQFDSDNVLLRFKEDRDVALGKKYDELKTEAATINNEAKAMQNRLQVQSISQFGVRLEDLVDYEPKSQQELTDMINMYRQYGDAAAQRQAAALGYEKAMTYYDKQYDKGVTEEYVDGWEEVSVAWSNGLKRGNAMSKLLLMQFGYYDVFGDDGAEEQAMREVSAIMDSQDKRRGRIVSRANMTGTTDSYLNSIASNPAMYTAAITAESLSQLVPIWGRVLPAGVALGGAYGLAGGPVGVLGGGFTGLLGGAVAGITAVGMPVSELALELGNATLEAGESRGYDWADPNSALKALNDEEMWAEASDRGWKRGVPIMLTGILSNYFIGKAVSGSARLATRGERMARGIGTGLVVEPATEALGERIALGVVGDYTGSTQNFKEIMAEAIGAVGMGMSMGAAFGAVGYAKQVLGESNFDLGVRLMTPEGLAQENVSNERIVEWANKMETLGQLTPEQANAIRKNTGLRRDANELLGRRPGARPGTKGRVVGRLMELLQAKETLESRGPNAKQVFGKRISEINEEIAYIAENSALPEKRVNLEGLGADIPASYKFNGKSVTREDFLAQIQEATPKQLKKAKVYGDPQTKQELDTRRNAIQKREAAEVPVGEQPGVSPPVDEQVREATQEDLQAEEQGTLDPDRKAVILESIAEKLNDEVELNEVEQAFLEDNKEDIEADQKRLETLDQEAAEVEVLGEPEVQGRIPLKRLKRLASNAKKALAKNFPDANIIIHNDKASYQQAAQENGLTGERSAGFLGTDDKTIHIFAPLASETTVAHETFHAILRNTIDSAQTQELMGEFVTTLKKVIPADKPLAAKLDKYQQLYDAGQMNEEYVAEFFGELAAAYPTLDTKGKSVIARFLERLGKLFGVDLKLSPDLTARDKQILSLLERLAGQVSRGETVTARETEALRSLTTERQQAEPEVESELEAIKAREDEVRSEFREIMRTTDGATRTEAENARLKEVEQELKELETRRKAEIQKKLRGAEQRVDDFSDEQMESMSKQGVAFHFSDVDITKVLPEKLKRTIYGYGFYTTSEGRSDSVFRRYGDRVTLIDTNQLNLLDGDTRITEEQAKKLRDFAKMELEELDETGDLLYFPEKAIVLQSLAELKAGAAWANVLIEGSAEAVFGDVKMVPRELANRSTTPDVITYDIPQQAQVAALIQEAFGFDGADFGRAVNMDETGYGIISAIWNFDKLNRAIIEPGQEPRAAEQRVDIKTDGTGINIEGNEPVKAGQISPTVRIDATKKRDAFLEDDFRLDDIDGTITSRASAAVGTARRLASGKVVYTKDGVKYIIELPYENKRLLSLLNRRSNAVAAVKGDTDKAKAKRAKLLERVKETTNEILAEAVEVMTQNILAVYDTLTPEFVATSKEWYVGANRVANRMAEIYGVTVEEAAGVLAALSPQNDWFNNIAVAERTFEVLENHSDTPFSREVFDKALALNMDRKGPSKWGKQLAAEFAQYEGMTLNEMEAQGVPVTVQTNLLRAIDQAMYPGKVLMTTPDGDFIGFDSTPIRWSSPVEIAKAMDMYRNPSIENIREQLGGGNKVRNFYNNIVDPNSTSPYVTADTHAASVALGIPMSANDAGGFGVFKGGRSIEYALIKEAYINAAEIAGILPREMQSITWEAQRTGINNKNRTASEIKANVELLKRLLNDETLTPYERTRRIIAENPSENPGWATSRGIEAQLSDLLEGIEAQAESRGREVLSVRRGAGRDVGDAAARVGEPAAEGRAAEQRGAQAAEQRVYRAGDLVNKVEPRSEALSGRSTGHFGTGFYFFGDKSAAESNAERTNRPVTELDITDYRLAPASYFLHAALQEVNKRAMEANREGRPHTITPQEIQYAQVAVEQGPSFKDFYYMNDALRIYKDQLLDEGAARRIAAEATRLYNEPGNVDSPSTSVMKALGYEGVNAVGTELDNYTYGTVIYDVKPGTAEQRGAQAAEQQVFVNERGTEYRRAGESRMRPMTLETLENFVYRSGKVTDKAEPRGMMDGGRSTGHFGTGAYFFSDRKEAEKYDDREVTAVDTRDYNLAPASLYLHKMLRKINGRVKYKQPHTFTAEEVEAVLDAIRFPGIQTPEIRAQRKAQMPEAERAAKEATRLYNKPGNIDSASTSVMKALGYEGVYATPGSDMDNATYGTVIYDVRPGAAEQRVVGPELAKVLQRYEFKSNNSLKNAELAPELRRNLKRFGYGVKQYGTRMNDFRVVSLDTGRAVDPNKLIEEGLAEGLAIAEQQREFEAEQRARELEERIIEIYNADERPYTGRDFEGRAAEQKVVVEAMAEPGTIADLVARGRELGLRDASIRSVLLKRFGKDNADAIDTALTEYFDMFRAIPEAFGNVEGGIEVGRQIYDDVRRQLDEFARPKKPGRMTTRERTDRIAELRAKFPEQKKLSDTELLRRHPRQAVAPAIADVRAEALNLLRNNRLFNEQTTEVQEQLLVAFDKTLQTKANKQVNTLISQIRNNIRQRRKGAKNARTVQTQLRKLINEVLPRGKYGKRDINRLNKLVAEVNEDNYFDKAEEVLKIVDKQREAIRQSLLTDIENIVKKAAKTRRTPTGKIRPRSLDAPGQAFFRTALRVLKAARADDATQIENIKANLSHNPEVDEVTQKYLNGETLTSREQQIMDQKSALDIFYEVNGKSIEELEAIIEDLKISAAFSRANLKATRAARAERMAALREGAKESVTRDWGDLAVSEDGTAKSQNQIESDLRKQKSLGEALKTRGMRAKYDALMEWAQEGKRMAPAKIAKNAWSHYGSLTGIMGEFFRENLYKRLGKMEEDYLRGKFKERENLDAMANSIEGITNGFVEIGEIIFTNGDLTVKYGNTSRKFTTDELLRIYALSLNPVQKQRLMLMGFTDEVMADITEFLDDRLIEFADKTVAYLSTDYYEGVNDVHVKVNDVNLPYVENYFPTKTQLEEFFRLDDEQALRSTFFGPNAQLASPLKDRVAQTSEISLKRDLGFHGELTSHINSMERFKAFAEGTQEMNAVLSDSYTTALANLIGAEKAVVMLAAQGVSPERFMSEMRAPLVDKLVSRYTGVSLGYKLMQIPKQASSMFAGIQDYQYGDKKNPIIDRIMWSVDMMRILPGAILEGISLAKYKGPIQQMMEESSTLRSRMEETLEGDLYGLATGASGTATKLSKKDFQKAQKALKGVRKGGAAVTAFGDALGVLGYVPAYQRNRQRGMSKREAIDKFNEYNETQQSRRPGERAPIQIYRDGYRRLLTAFTSSQLLYLNNMIRLTAQINRSVRQGGWRSVSASDLRGLYFNTFGAAFTFAIASNIMLILFGSDEEKEKAWYDVLFSWTKNFFIYPILGSTAESVYNKLMGNQYPKRIALDPLDRVERSMTKAVKDGDFGPAIQNTTEMLIGTNLDPAISLIEVAGGEPLEDEIYDIIGVPKSQRPE